MDITLPDGCGNAPRIGIVADIVGNWARSDRAALEDWLGEDATWTLVGAGTRRGRGAAAQVAPPFSPERMELTSIITHGRLASCDGFLEAGGERLCFSHALRFAGAAKTARIADVRSYCIREGGGTRG
ncbi:hypothetical protein DEO23_02035 [Brachybacterium endophyticum]|uniref:SnoaL-like domain-containing protein n=1 Tax=Brachybacterium endophyticum TaxID=2182385 RepID=A0A2U2RNI6_9MICO|nr:hypothetical protein [Brachybacterium endophyticum]PWH07439.1 hypothetical protein DEO23_02035 [Brachybacterium endophyticum]